MKQHSPSRAAESDWGTLPGVVPASTRVAGDDGIARTRRSALGRLANRSWNPRGLHDVDALRPAVVGKTVLVTGASYGLGEATARLLARAGATVLLVARTAERLDAIVAEITAEGGRAVAYPTDLTDDDQIDQLVARIELDHPSVDVVVNNAGKSIRRLLHDQYDRPQDFTRTASVNYLGPVRLLLGLLPRMRAQGNGHIVNISTIGARVTPAPRWGAYQASKSAFDIWLRSVTRELERDGIDVSSIYLALVLTRMSAPTQSVNRVPGLTPEEAAELVALAIVTRKPRIAPWWVRPIEAMAVLPGRPMERVLGIVHDLSRDVRRSDPPAPRRPRRRDDAALVANGIRTLRRAGVLAVLSPRTVMRIRRAARWGSSIATVGSVAAARWPERLAVIDDHRALTYRELDDRAEALAAALAGHAPGSGPIGVLCRNHHWFVETVLAAARLGRDVVLLNTDFSASQLASSIERFDLDVLVHDAAFAETVAGIDTVVALVADAPVTSPRTLEHLIATGGPPVAPPSQDGRIVILTSGTTGQPKGVARDTDVRRLAGPLLSMVDRMDLREGEVVAIAPPLFHGFGMGYLGLCLTIGATAVLHQRFDPDAVLDSVHERRVTTLAVVPVMLQRLLRAGGLERATSLRAVLTGGAPLPPALASRFMDEVGPVLFNGYGSSEIGMVSLATPDDLRALPGTVGRPVAGTEVRVLDDRGAPVQLGHVGRIVVGSDMIVPADSSGLSAERPSAADSGDRGYLTEDGRLVVLGRSDDMIISGGENVYPQVLEHALAAHPSVADVAVVGVADSEFGQRLRAFVVPASETLTSDELMAFAHERVARFETPREVVFVDELPRNPTGKILRTRLRELEPS